MIRGFRLRAGAVILCVAAGMALAMVAPASASTGVGGFTILDASGDQAAHVCQVISDDTIYQAVVCADLATYEGDTDYYVYARAEAYCQLAAAPHTEVACKAIRDAANLGTGGGDTGEYSAYCGDDSGETACPDARINADTRTWDYSISAAQNGTCSSNPNSSYNVWGLVWGDDNGAQTFIETPDNEDWALGLNAIMPNDGVNESTGHYYVCP